MIGLVLKHFDVLTEKLLNADQITRLGFVAKRVSQTVSARSSRSSDAVNVHFRFVGQIKIEHVRDVFNIDAAAGDIGGDEDEDIAVFE